MLASNFLEMLRKVNIADLENEKGLGPILIKNLEEYINSDRFEIALKKLKELEDKNLGISLLEEVNHGAVLDTEGNQVSFCITGSFEASREQITEVLTNNGFKVLKSVSSKLHYLVSGANSGSNLNKANELKIPVIEGIDGLQNLLKNEFDLDIDFYSTPDTVTDIQPEVIKSDFLF